jgi:hypothetical protein
MSSSPLHSARRRSRAGAGVLFDERNVLAAMALMHPDVSSERQAARLFKAVARTSGRGRFQTTDWVEGQAWVRRWILSIAEFDSLSKAMRAQVLAAINEAFAAVNYEVITLVGEEGLRFASEKDSIFTTCVRAFLPFVVPNGWPPMRLACCQYENCRQWFLRPAIGRGNRRSFCSEKHANVARVRAFRARQGRRAATEA